MTVGTAGSSPEAKELQRRRDGARTGCSEPLGRQCLSINRQRMVGDLLAADVARTDN
jgi:hypothetical protein